MSPEEFQRYLSANIRKLDSKSLFSLAGACMVVINDRIKEGTLEMKEV
jgi:hypothetical protein